MLMATVEKAQNNCLTKKFDKMKKLNVSKKLSLNKETILNLDKDQMRFVKGGEADAKRTKGNSRTCTCCPTPGICGAK